jgi:hypothetical protein
MRPAPARSASDLRLPASTTVRSRVTGAGRRCSNADTSGADTAFLPVVGDSDGDVGSGRIIGILQQTGDPGRPLLAPWGQHDQHERDVMHPVNAADKPPDHRLIKFTKHLEEPVLARFARQAAEPVAQHLGIGRQQRPDQRTRAVLQRKLPRQHLTARLSHSRTAPCRSAPCQIHLIASFRAFSIPKRNHYPVLLPADFGNIKYL